MRWLNMVSLHPSSLHSPFFFYLSVNIPAINTLVKGILCLTNMMLGSVFLSCRIGLQVCFTEGLWFSSARKRWLYVPLRATIIHIKKVRYLNWRSFFLISLKRFLSWVVCTLLPHLTQFSLVSICFLH